MGLFTLDNFPWCLGELLCSAKCPFELLGHECNMCLIVIVGFFSSWLEARERQREREGGRERERKHGLGHNQVVVLLREKGQDECKGGMTVMGPSELGAQENEGMRAVGKTLTAAMVEETVVGRALPAQREGNMA